MNVESHAELVAANVCSRTGHRIVEFVRGVYCNQCGLTLDEIKAKSKPTGDKVA